MSCVWGLVLSRLGVGRDLPHLTHVASRVLLFDGREPQSVAPFGHAPCVFKTSGLSVFIQLGPDDALAGTGTGIVELGRTGTGTLHHKLISSHRLVAERGAGRTCQTRTEMAGSGSGSGSRVGQGSKVNR